MADVLAQLIGQTLDDKYHIEKQLGQGGMGAVYLATHIGTERPVALKVIMPQFMDNQESVERFKREARAAGRLLHPNVVNVTDFGFARSEGGTIAYLVMEYLKGYPLSTLLKKRGQLPIKMVLEITEQIAIAIDEAHRQGIIHRDLKPDNIWLSPEARGHYHVKVLDFGLAKLRVNNDDDAHTTQGTHKLNISDPALLEAQQKVNKDTDKAVNHTSTQEFDPYPTQEGGNLQTRMGTVVGTPYYMSPEQCGNDVIDARTDIYSLGIIVYQMLAGDVPFKGENIFQLIFSHTSAAPPPIRNKRKEISTSLENVVMAALAKRPSDRPISANAFSTALHTNAEGEGPIFRQALELYTRNFAASLKLSAIMQALFMVINSLITLALVISETKSLPGPLHTFTHELHLFVSLVLILFANRVSTAAFAIFVEQLRTSPLKKINVASIFIRINRNLWSLLSTFFIGWARLVTDIISPIKLARAFISLSFYPCINLLEGTSGVKSIKRSEVLVDRLRTLAMRIHVRDTALALLTVLAFFITSIFCGLVLDFYKPVEASRLPLIILFSFIPSFIPILFHPTVAIAHNLVYFNACDIGGETIHKEAEEDFEHIDDRQALSMRTTATLFAIPIMAFVIWYGVKDSVLRFALARNYHYTIEALLAAGANVDTRDSEDRTALMSAVFVGDIDAVKVLIAAGANVNAYTKQQHWVPLMFVADSGQAEVVPLLVNAGAQVDARNSYGTTPLHRASRHGFNEVIIALLKAGANVNVKNQYGSTPLMEAADDAGDADTIEILAKAGANVNEKDNNNKTAIALAYSKERWEIVNELKRFGAIDDRPASAQSDNPEESTISESLGEGTTDNTNKDSEPVSTPTPDKPSNSSSKPNSLPKPQKSPAPAKPPTPNR